MAALRPEIILKDASSAATSPQLPVKQARRRCACMIQMNRYSRRQQRQNTRMRSEKSAAARTRRHCWLGSFNYFSDLFQLIICSDIRRFRLNRDNNNTFNWAEQISAKPEEKSKGYRNKLDEYAANMHAQNILSDGEYYTIPCTPK